MKRKVASIALFILLLVVALVFSAANGVVSDGTNSAPTPWVPVPPETASIKASPTPGWWDELPTAIPFPYITAER